MGGSGTSSSGGSSPVDMTEKVTLFTVNFGNKIIRIQLDYFIVQLLAALAYAH